MNKVHYQKQYQGDPNVFGKVAVLFGGDSAEREVSLKSGNAVLGALVDAGVNATGIDFLNADFSQLLDEKYDRVFIALHGIGGEDGKLQAILDAINLPYTGSDHASSALAMDKLRTKLVWQSLDIPTPIFSMLSANSPWGDELAKLEGEAFVKPIREGSSIGMSVAKTSEQLEEAFKLANKHDAEVIAERRIVTGECGGEFTVAILNGVVLPVVQIKMKNDFYDFDAKYLSDNTEYSCPAQISAELTENMQKIAVKAFDSVGCKGWGRVDVMVDENQQAYLLEVNTVPGMTDHSLVPMAAKAAGLSFQELVLEILQQTLEVSRS